MYIMNTVLAAFVIAASACTPRADAVAPVSMTGAFDHLSCSKANAELGAERQTCFT